MADEAVKKITNYPSNSHKDREQKAAEQREPVKKIEGIKVTQRKKPLGRKIAEAFSGDDASSIGQYVLFDVILPSAKDMIFDAAKEALQRALYPDGGGKSSRNSGGRSNHTSYNKMYGSVASVMARNESPARSISKRARSTHDFDGELLFDTRADAQEVLESLQNFIDKYEMVSVAELYTLLELTGSFTDDKYGWTSLQGSDVRHVRGGYLLLLPDTVELDS